jgi:hypothetical protein
MPRESWNRMGYLLLTTSMRGGREIGREAGVKSP